jgi:hypothetical protein
MFVEVLIRGRAFEFLRQLLRSERETLLEDDRTWSSAGHAMVTLDRYREARRWLADWRQRGTVTSTLLLHLAVSLRMGGRDAEAAEVSRHALELAADRSTFAHTIWTALEDALDGDSRLARERLESLAEPVSASDERFLTRVVDALTVSRSPGGKLADASPLLRDAVRAVPTFRRRECRELRRLYRRALARIRREHGGLGSCIWWCLERLRA